MMKGLGETVTDRVTGVDLGALADQHVHLPVYLLQYTLTQMHE